MRKFLVLFTLFLLPLIALYGCGSEGVSISSNTTGDTPTLTKTGELVVSAKFPQNGKKGEIGTALIDVNTATIEVNVYDSSGSWHGVELTPTNPTGRIANIAVGPVYIDIYTYDSSQNMLDYLYVGGEIVEGQNTLVATLIRGSWQFVDANNAATSIRLNKTYPDDTTTLTSFSVTPYWYYSMKKSSIDWNKLFAESEYKLLWKGSGFSSELCGYTEICWDEGLSYFNQFIGPSTNNNAIDSQYLPLSPTAEGYRRSAFIAGTAPEGMSDISDPDILNYLNSKVTGPNTMEGNIVELLTKSEEETLTCYDLSGNPITCPETGSASKSNKGRSKAIAKAISQRAGKSAIDSDGCFRDLTVSSTDEWEGCADLDNDGWWCESPDDWFKVVATWEWRGDACVHPFKAIGGQLPTTDLELVVQKGKK